MALATNRHLGFPHGAPEESWEPGKVWEEGGSEVPRGRPERILGVPWELHSGMMRQVGLTFFLHLI